MRTVVSGERVARCVSCKVSILIDSVCRDRCVYAVRLCL